MKMTMIDKTNPKAPTTASRLHIAGLATATMALALLAGCGGGGNESGPPDVLEAQPSAVSVGMTGECAPGPGPTVTVWGGQPPYKLTNSLPAAMTLDKSRLTYSGEGFTITFINGICMTNMPVSIEDDMGRLLHVLVSKGA
ncbi:MAG: hypothetical protein ACOZJX_14165 [Pseudomonadota bacterium]